MAVAVNWRKPSPFLGHKFATRSANLSSGQCMGNSFQPSRISALFWQSRKSREAQEIDSFLGQFSLAGSGSEDTMVKLAQPKTITVSVVSFISEVASSEWDACALDATGTEKFNPFLTHGFLSSLEDSGSAVKATGWMPRHIIAKDEDNKVVGVVPLYLKSHSYGEFVFDHSWADAYYSYGLKYYPKLQCCVPFTPVTGPRILVRNTSYKDQVFDIIVSAMKDLADKNYDYVTVVSEPTILGPPAAFPFSYSSTLISRTMASSSFSTSNGSQRWLRQRGNVKEFNVSFDEATSNLQLPEEDLVVTYVAGLKDETAKFVRFFNPLTMCEARSIARAEEIFLQWRRKKARRGSADQEGLATQEKGVSCLTNIQEVRLEMQESPLPVRAGHLHATKNKDAESSASDVGFASDFLPTDTW